jgi:hypothetical protein
MYPKRKTYSKPYRKTSAPKSYRNGYSKTSKTITAYLNGAKLLMKSYSEGVNDRWNLKFDVIKNYIKLGSASGVLDLDTKVLVITWKTKKYILLIS